jgi:hypothetical protein
MNKESMGASVENTPENSPAVVEENTDDLISQARDVGKVGIDFGKKTGKFFFNVSKLGIQKLGEGTKKLNENIAKEKERLAEWSDDRLAREAKSKGILPSGIAAMQILKERGYSGTDIASM